MCFTEFQLGFSSGLLRCKQKQLSPECMPVPGKHMGSIMWQGASLSCLWATMGHA
jgi:hypothetical protein